MVGDYSGNLALKKLENGVLVKNLYHHKHPVILIFVREIAGNILIASVSQEGEIGVFERD